jgi:hypothetical protein
MIALGSNPLMRPLRKRALRLIDELREASEEMSEDGNSLL